MAKKAPRRTAERILEVTLALFNRFGEPNVSTTLISAELGISPGNLYYHYPAKDELINSLLERYEKSLSELLGASEGVRDVEDAWFFMHTLFELIWEYRFLYRDLNDLLSKNRKLETHFQRVIENKTRAVKAMLSSMTLHRAMPIDFVLPDEDEDAVRAGFDRVMKMPISKPADEPSPLETTKDVRASGFAFWLWSAAMWTGCWFGLGVIYARNFS